MAKKKNARKQNGSLQHYMLRLPDDMRHEIRATVDAEPEFENAQQMIRRFIREGLNRWKNRNK